MKLLSGCLVYCLVANLLTVFVMGGIAMDNNNVAASEMTIVAEEPTVNNYLAVPTVVSEEEGEGGGKELQVQVELQPQHPQGRRKLEEDFARFNELFRDASVNIEDDFEVTERLLFLLTLKIRHIRCFDIAVGNIIIDNQYNNREDIDVSIRVNGLNLTCDVDYRYDYGVFRGSGVANVKTSQNSMFTLFSFASENYNSFPPSGTTVDQCDVDLNIERVTFTGDRLSDFLENFQNLIIGVLEPEVEKVACNELNSLGGSFLGDFVDLAGSTLDPYTGTLGSEYTDPLHLERTTVLPADLAPLNLQETDSILGGWFDQALSAADSLLGAVVPDPNGPNPDGRDLGANVLMRQNILDANRELVVTASQLGINPVLFDGHDQITETTITLNSVIVKGLDTLSVFNPMMAVGMYTLQNQLTWDSLMVEFDITVDIKPSTLDGAILEGATSSGISERIKIDFGVENVQVLASLFLVIDEEALSSMEIGPLLHSENILSCLLSLIHRGELSGLSVDPQTVSPPTLTGFVSAGIDRLVTDSVAAAYRMYAGVLRNAIPNIFRTSVRNFVNDEVIDPYLNDPTRTACPDIPFDAIGEFIDFRDLFLSPQLAGAFGAAGTEPYGDLASFFMGLLEENLLTVDSNGLLDLNSFLIDPITESQSGEAGTLRLSGDLLSFTKTEFKNEYVRSFVNYFEIGLSDARIFNLNTLKRPVLFLEPNIYAYKLENLLTMGPVQNRPINATVGFRLVLEGDDSPLAMDNDVDVSVSFDSAAMNAILFATISTENFLRFPLYDILSPQCWLATIPPPIFDIYGERWGDPTLALQDIGLALSSLNMDVSVLSSNRRGLSIIPTLLDIFKSLEGGDLLLSRITSFANEMIDSDWLQKQIDHALVSAPRFCPHRDEYDPNAVSTQLDVPFPALSTTVIDTIFYGGALVAEIGFLVFLESHRLDPVSTDPLSRQNAADVFDVLFDWTSLQGEAGPLMESVIDELQGYVGGNGTDAGKTDLNINILIRDWLLQEGQLLWLFDDISFGLPGVRLHVRNLNVTGVDSFTRFDIWEPIAPQTVQNFFKLEGIRVQVQVDVTDAITGMSLQEFGVAFSISDIEFDISLYAAMLKDDFESLPLGAFMELNNIVPCLLSVLESIEITQIVTRVGSFNDPELTGLLPDTDASIVAFTDELLLRYRQQIEETFPLMVDDTARGLLNGLVQAYMTEQPCMASVPPEVSEYVDFREFFDSDESAYGNIPPLLKRLLDDEVLTVDSATGMSRINEVIIRPWTVKQSGTSGTLGFPGDMFGFKTDTIPQFGMESIEFRAYDPSLENVDTVGVPVQLLDANPSNGYILDNSLTFMALPDSLQFAMNGLFAFEGDPALSMYNNIKVMVNLANDGTDMIASLMAKMDPEILFSFPLRDMIDEECWYYALASPLLDENGDIRIDGNGTGLSIESILLTVPSVKLNATCTNCTTTGLYILPELFEVFELEGVTDVLDERIVEIALDLLRGDYMQAFLNRLLVDGSRRCPHSPYFVDSSHRSDYPFPKFPALSYDSLESVAFLSTVMMHVTMVVVAETHKTYVLEDNDPLSGQLEIDSLPEFRFLDFTSLATLIGEWADVGVEQLLDYLTTVVDDADGPNGRDLRVNGILRSTLLDENGELEMFFNNTSVGNDDMAVALKHIRIVGLDTITVFDVMDAIGPQTLQNHLKWGRLGFEAVISLTTFDGIEGGETIRFLEETEEITLKIELADVDMSLALLLGMDLDLLGSLELRTILDVKNILPCILSAARLAKLTELQVSVGTIKEFSVKGFRSRDLEDAAALSSEVILENYGGQILESMPAFFDVTVRALANNWMGYFMGRWPNEECPLTTYGLSGSGFVDFRDLFMSAEAALSYGAKGTSPYGDLFRTVMEYVQDLVLKVDPETGLSDVNDVLVGPYTRSQSNVTGTWQYPGDVFNGGTRLQVGGLDASIKIHARDARIENLDTIGSPLSIFETLKEDPSILNNTASFGVAERPLRFGVKLLFSLVGDEGAIENDVDITLDLSSATLIVGALLKVAESRFFTFPLRDVLDFNCWLATIPAPVLTPQGIRLEGTERTAGLSELVATIWKIGMNVECLDCSGPRMEEFVELLATPEAQEDANEVFTDILTYITDLMGGAFLQVQIDRMLNDAARMCPHSPEYQPSFVASSYEPFVAPDNEYSVTFLMLLGGVAVGSILSVCFLVAIIRCIVRRRHRRWLRHLPAHQVEHLARRQKEDEEAESALNGRTKSMFTSPEIPLYVRWSMPVILLVNVGFFLSGHLSLGATVNIEAQLAGQTFRVDQFFQFSMAKSTVDIWNAGGRELAILILIFSGVWPYTKQFITFALWFLPPTSLSTSRRGSILLWLDWLAKWSMIDIFVLVISLAAFRLSILSPDVGFLPSDFYSIDLLVVPLWGLYANMIAQLISQVSSHFIIYYHRKIVKAATEDHPEKATIDNSDEPSATSSDNDDDDDDEDNDDVELDDFEEEHQRASERGNESDHNTSRQAVEKKTKLHKHEFGRPHRGETEKVQIRKWVNPSLLFVSMLLLVSVIVGCTMAAFSLEILGLIGVVVESGQGFEEATTNHSVFTVIRLLFEEAEFLGTVGDYVGLGTLSMLLLFTVLIVPIAQCLALLYQWFTPSTDKQFERMSIIIETLQAWQYAEVYLIAIFVASWQLGPVSEFMINSYCADLEDTFAQMVYFGILKEEDAQCFSVQSSIESGSYILAIGAVLLALINTIVGKAVVQYFRDQGERTRRTIEPTEEEPSQDQFEQESEEDAPVKGNSQRVGAINPVPVLFTDTFRWLLQGTSQVHDDLEKDVELSPDETTLMINEESRFSMMASEDYDDDDETPARVMQKPNQESSSGNLQALPVAAMIEPQSGDDDDASQATSAVGAMSVEVGLNYLVSTVDENDEMDDDENFARI